MATQYVPLPLPTCAPPPAVRIPAKAPLAKRRSSARLTRAPCTSRSDLTTPKTDLIHLRRFYFTRLLDRGIRRRHASRLPRPNNRAPDTPLRTPQGGHTRWGATQAALCACCSPDRMYGAKWRPEPRQCVQSTASKRFPEATSRRVRAGSAIRVCRSSSLKRAGNHTYRHAWHFGAFPERTQTKAARLRPRQCGDVWYSRIENVSWGQRGSRLPLRFHPSRSGPTEPRARSRALVPLTCAVLARGDAWWEYLVCKSGLNRPQMRWEGEGGAPAW